MCRYLRVKPPDAIEITRGSPGRGDRPKLVCRPSGAGNKSLLASGGYAPLHHRLISAVPPALKTCVETLAVQFALFLHSKLDYHLRPSFIRPDSSVWL